MNYQVSIRRGDEIVHLEDTVLDGIVPRRVLDMIEANYLDENTDICKSCPRNGSITHVLEEVGKDTYRLLCPYLFVDLFPVKWKVSQLV